MAKMTNNSDNNRNIFPRGVMLIISSPSGAGKTTICKKLLEKLPNLVMSVSVTTRKKREGEVEGVDYYFVNNEQFAEMVANGELLECAHVFGNSYGTPAKMVMDALAEGKDVLFDIDWQGTKQVLNRSREDVASVFILPPSIEELERRLRGRGKDSEDVVQGRMAKATEEICQWALYDYVVINDDVGDSVKRIIKILEGEKQRRHRQEGLTDFVKTLIS